MTFLRVAAGHLALTWALHGAFACVQTPLLRRVGLAPSPNAFAVSYYLATLVVSSVTSVLYALVAMQLVVLAFEPWRTTPLAEHALAQHLAVTTYEWSTFAVQKKGLALHAHHALTVVSLVAFLLVGRGGGWACWGALVELTNPPLSVSMLCHELGAQTSRGWTRRVRLASNATVCTSYAIFRLAGIPLMLAVYGYCCALHPKLARFSDDPKTNRACAIWFVTMSTFVLGLSVVWFGKLRAYQAKYRDGLHAE